MKDRKIYCLNNIAKIGTDGFRSGYSLIDSMDEAAGVLVRSADMKEMTFPAGLRAIARAGAGVNNIPLDRCAEEGIVVFNTPGANANSVKELVLCGMLLAARDVAGGISWVRENAGDENIAKTTEKAKKAFAGNELKGKTLGVIGLGAIGVLVANAAVALGVTVKELTVDCGVDILSFGGTKNGCMMAESVVAFRPELAENLKYLRKQTTQLFSKMRYVAAQFIAYFEDDLLYKNAAHANEMARLLRRKIEEVGPFEFTQKTQANTLLLKMEPQMTEEMLKKHFFYVWDENTHEIRLVTSWDTTEKDVLDFAEDLRRR